MSLGMFLMLRGRAHGSWRRSFQLLYFLGYHSYHGVDLLSHLRLLCLRDAGAGLLLLLVAVLHLDYPGGQLPSFGEGWSVPAAGSPGRLLSTLPHR
ncbi:hypothetical protein T05_2699 [Trichinella murrelli]|uniref:Uncharacterized protein n=1 Tax=Trichinella murrelli TaxID=144512 RepID=A0A0V0TP00_9BILA|nr:hypothetical protein T05_2699 [Trichinella murrelli]